MGGIIAEHQKPRSRHEAVEALLRAFTEHDLPAIQALADAGCDLEATSGGLTVLMRAVLRRDAEAVEWILAAGADPRVASSDGKTALDLARDLGATELAELLVLAGASSGAAEAAAAGALPDPAPPRETLPAPRLPVAAGPDSPPRACHAFDDRFDDHFEDRLDDHVDDRVDGG